MQKCKHCGSEKLREYPEDNFWSGFVVCECGHVQAKVQVKVRVSPTVVGFLCGTQAWQDPGKDPLADGLMKKIADSPHAGNVVLYEDEVAVLREYAEAMAGAAADNVGPFDPSALGELNAARALLRQLDKVGV